jgi:hypothetical protein
MGLKTNAVVTVVVVPTSLAVAPGTLSAGARGPTDPRVRLSRGLSAHSRSIGWCDVRGVRTLYPVGSRGRGRRFAVPVWS